MLPDGRTKVSGRSPSGQRALRSRVAGGRFREAHVYNARPSEPRSLVAEGCIGLLDHVLRNAAVTRAGQVRLAAGGRAARGALPFQTERKAKNAPAAIAAMMSMSAMMALPS